MTTPEWDTEIMSRDTPDSAGHTAPQTDGDGPPRRRLGLTRNWMVIWVVGTLAALSIGYLAGFLVRTPLDQAQENSAVAIEATATVTMHEFLPDIATAKGEVRKGRTVTLPEFTLPGGESPIVTERIAKAGATVPSGKPVVSIAGYPVFVLSIPFPLYRDLAPGDSGQDVKALQTELSRLGHYTGSIDGEYGPGMAAAVRDLYRSAAATAPQASAELRDAVTAAQQELNAARGTTTSNTGDTPNSDAAENTGAADGTGPAANTSTAALTAALNAATLKADTPLPKFSVIAIPGKKVDVIKAPAVGTSLADGADSLQLRSQGTSATGRLTVLDAEGFAEGDTVSITVQTNTNVTGEGKITSISDFTEGDNANNIPPGYDFVVNIPSEDAAAFSDNDAVTITNNQQTAKGTTALAVPLLAIRQDANGTYVLTVDDPATAADPTTHTRVDVTAGQQQDGWVDVTGANLTDTNTVVLGGGR
ncbi:peptidoglycan-binding protein [Jonesia quinghaiensis]|uniref:peptidoglycan-binding protein n=1 Tax=Jonesia quinghaiensis TaxID=262806 RepID=UPI0003F58289|nr:peptidoglycan-binding protein [Jonesia quinghaiensis]